MNCNIIKDLLPSYIDGISSEDTKAAVENHTRICSECARALQIMQQTADPLPDPEVEEAKAPFKRINRYRRLQVLTAVLFTLLLTIAGSFVVQDVGVVNQVFFPKVFAIVNITDDPADWQSTHFYKPHSDNQGQDHILYKSVFWKKELINDANSDKAILLRVKDGKGNIVIDETRILPGHSVKLKSLKRNQKYFIEVKAPTGRYSINAV